MTERLAFEAHLGDNGSVRRARETEAAVTVEQPGVVLLAFADSDDVHEVVLRRDGDEWHGDCWALHSDGDRRERCRGLTYSPGPCAHLWRVRSAVAAEEIGVPDAAEERADHHVERARADGGRRVRR